MRLDEKVFYHGGWLLGVGWVLLGLLHVYLWLRFRTQSDPTLAAVYLWTGAGMALVGVVWFLYWFFYARTFVEGSTGQEAS